MPGGDSFPCNHNGWHWIEHMRILIIGATSTMAEAVARIYAQRGADLCLLARDADRLEALAADLRIRGANAVRCASFDAALPDSCDTALANVLAGADGFDLVLIAHGSLPVQSECDASVAQTRSELEVNLVSVLAMLVPLASHFEQRGRGTIAVIGSVAGDRGRQPNCLYGAAKSALATYLQGLRSRLHGSGVHVMTIKPGRVDTPMSAAVESGIPMISADEAARQIVRGIERGRDVIYLPAWWRYVMWMLCQVPEWLFKRFSF